MLLFGYILLVLLLLSFAYLIYNQYHEDQQKTVITKEGFYPVRWGWRRPWLHHWGNWRPYGYYPAYSGYWKQCPSGSWCPATMSCRSPACN
jgi:hypothetical protein